VLAQRDLSQPLRIDDVDSSSSVLTPFYDYDTHIVYLAGKVRPQSTLSCYVWILLAVLRGGGLTGIIANK